MKSLSVSDQTSPSTGSPEKLMTAWLKKMLTVGWWTVGAPTVTEAATGVAPVRETVNAGPLIVIVQVPVGNCCASRWTIAGSVSFSSAVVEYDWLSSVSVQSSPSAG